MNEQRITKIEDAEITEGPVTTVSMAKAREEGLWTSLVDMAQLRERDWGKVMREATAMVTYSEEAALRCGYAFERGGKMIVGPSINLAKALQAAAGMIAVRVRSSHETATQVVVDIAALDLCKMNYVEVQVSRKIVGKDGRRFNEDMINVTRAAAQAIGHRNGVLNLMPQFVIDAVYLASKQCAVGDIESVAGRRATAIDLLHKALVTDDMILKALGLQTLDQIMVDELLVLRTMYRQMRDEGKSVEEVFQPGAMEAIQEAKASEEKLRAASAVAKEKAPAKAKAKAKEEPKSEPPTGEPSAEEKAAIIAAENAEAARAAAEVNASIAANPGLPDRRSKVTFGD